MSDAEKREMRSGEQAFGLGVVAQLKSSYPAQVTFPEQHPSTSFEIATKLVAEKVCRVNSLVELT